MRIPLLQIPPSPLKLMRDLRYHTLTNQLINYFGQTAILFQEGKMIEVVGVFDQTPIETLEVNNNQALFTVASQDLPTNLHGCILQLNDQRYQIVEVQADGAGAVTLILSDAI